MPKTEADITSLESKSHHAQQKCSDGHSAIQLRTEALIMCSSVPVT